MGSPSGDSLRSNKLGDPGDRVGYFNHDADIGIVGRGSSITEAFVAAAEAMFAVMVDRTVVRPMQSITIDFDESDPELAFVTWLNLLLAEARIARLMLANFSLRRDGHRWMGEAKGEPWPEDLERGVEVKGATLTELSVSQRNGVWEARSIIDV